MSSSELSEFLPVFIDLSSLGWFLLVILLAYVAIHNLRERWSLPCQRDLLTSRSSQSRPRSWSFPVIKPVQVASPHRFQREQKSSRKPTMAENHELASGGPVYSSPPFGLLSLDSPRRLTSNARLEKPPHSFGKRRGSILTQPELGLTDIDMKRSQSFHGKQSLDEEGSDVMWTPFAQILSQLKKVHANCQKLLSGLLGTFAPSESDDEDGDAKGEVDLEKEKSRKELAQETLQELDWCLHKLEAVHSQSSVGGMAKERLQRVISNELSKLRRGSSAGSEVAEWFNKSIVYNRDSLLSHPSVKRSSLLGRSYSGSDIPVSPPSQRKGSSLPGIHVSNPGALDKLFTDIHLWDFNMFDLEGVSDGQPLTTICHYICIDRDLYQLCKIPMSVGLRYFTAVEKNYHSRNRYHNRVHAADVVQAAHHLLLMPSLKDVFSPLEVFAVLFASAIHDVDHIGYNNDFLVATQHEIALLYHEESVLENHHLAVAFKLLHKPGCNILANWEKADQKTFKRMVSSMVLATDISKHVDRLAEIRTLVERKKNSEEGCFVLDNYEDRLEVMMSVVNCADISNPARPHEIALKWCDVVVEEFYHQGDEERKRGLPVSAIMDREKPSVAHSQFAFINCFVEPLWETLAKLVYPGAQEILNELAYNSSYWKSCLPLHAIKEKGNARE